ncbi:hypothetical protein [Sporosarcina sp. USHLN248]|uniref:hypothetical protein n=1 Tax=Sporosarcina sp. USHLN248 TaxID=3081300 RepID=UPI0030178478
MSEFRSIVFLSKFKRLFNKAGVDYDAMETILRMKLTMDGRRVPTIFNDTKKKKEGNQFLKSLWVYAIYGLMLVPFLFFGADNAIFQMSIIYSMVLFILTTTMISDFSSVLLDLRDKTILQTKPVSSRTVNTAKVIHIMIYMFFIAGSFVAVPIVVGLFRNGILFTLLFIATLFLAMLFIVVFTTLLYIAVLRFFDGERLRDIINYMQILLSIGIIIGYQIVIRLFNVVDMDLTYTFSWWHVFLPPMWFSGPFELILNQNYAPEIILFSVLSVLVPVLSMLLYTKLMPAFERNMDKLMTSTKNRTRKKEWWVNFWAQLCCRSREEKMFFRFASLMMKQERDFKLKVYPSLGLSIVFPFIFIFTDLQTKTWAEIATGKSYMYIYFANMMIPPIINMLKYSANYKGGFLFKTTPIEQPAIAYSGALKAFLVKLYAPIFVLLCIALMAIYSWRIAPDLFAVLLGAVLQTLLTYKWLGGGKFPFTESAEFAQSEGSGPVILLSLAAGAFVIMHFIASAFTVGIYIYIVLLLAVTLLGWRNVFKMKKTA